MPNPPLLCWGRMDDQAATNIFSMVTADHYGDGTDHRDASPDAWSRVRRLSSPETDGGRPGILGRQVFGLVIRRVLTIASVRISGIVTA